MEILFYLLCLIAGFALAWFILNNLAGNILKDAELKRTKFLEDAKSEIEDLKVDLRSKSRDELDQQRQVFENDYQNKQRELKKVERELNEKEIRLDKSLISTKRKEEEFAIKSNELETDKLRALEMRSHYRELADSVNHKLEHIAGMTKEQALESLKENLITEAQKQTSKIIYDIVEEARANANLQAKDIILQAIYQTGADQSSETTVSVVNLPDDTMKGRIIGREGRNIRSFESATGVDILIDDTPEMIIVSCFDPIRREIAKISLQRLIEDGRIHPGRIEDVILKVTNEMNDRHLEAGEQALFELGIHGMHGDLVQLIGKLRFRSMSGQNALKHSIEVAKIASMIAVQLDLDINIAKRAAILCEIGRVIDKNDISIKDRTIEVLKKYNEPKALIDILEEMAHPENIKNRLTYILLASKSISSARPGARKEIYESYTKRLGDLEKLCLSFEGVKQSFAIQTGRELRIMVDCDIIDDGESSILASKVAKKIEESMEYPGQVKVSVFREYRSVDFAK